MVDVREIVVIGAGPAGLAALSAATARGAHVTLIDAQAQAGGQIWRRDIAHPPRRVEKAAFAHTNGAAYRFGLDVVDADVTRRVLLTESPQGAGEIHWDRLILATGARELFLPFPGWTLPGVTGAGGLQALVKQGWPIAERRVVVAGSGPLLLATAASLRAHGAHVLAVIEQADGERVHAFARGLWRWPGKAVQALRLRLRLMGVRFQYGAVVRRAVGRTYLRAVEIERNGGADKIECDALAVGFGLVPETGLARLLGCALTDARHPAVRVDAMQRTSVRDIYAAGETCGIGGMQNARVEGATAGATAAGDTRVLSRYRARHRRAGAFADALAHTFAIGEHARALAYDDTIVCRCEDVTRGALRAFTDARSAKLGTRCGMGPCQGRICGAAMAELALWTWHGHARAPIFPARLATLATPSSAPAPEATTHTT